MGKSAYSFLSHFTAHTCHSVHGMKMDGCTKSVIAAGWTGKREYQTFIADS